MTESAARADIASPSDTAAAGGRHFAGSMLKAPVPAGVERELLCLAAEDGALVNGIRYRPVGAEPTTGIVVMHPVADFTQHYLLGPLAARGYTTLGVDSRFSDESNALLEQAVLDLAAGVRFLRDEGCEQIVLLGNSGGAGLVAFYQAEAEQPTVRATPAGDPPDLTAAELPAADALVLLNAHRGRAQVLTSFLDPSVLDERDPVATDPELNMFDPANGPPYAPEFVERYRLGQVARNERITRWAQARLAALSRHGIEDEAFVVHRTIAALEFLDLSLDPSDRPLGWYGDGSVESYNRAAVGLGRFATLRSWLSQFGLSTTNGLAERTLARTSVPVLVMQSTADQGVFPADARSLYEAVPQADKELVWIEQGLHFFTGQPDLQREVVDRAVTWLEAHALGLADR